MCNILKTLSSTVVLMSLFSGVVLAVDVNILNYVTTHQLPEGTHRPEILITESGEIIVVVVQPEGKPGVGQVKHKAYRYDANWNQFGEPFVVARNTAEYGEPADHRAAIVNGELVVVYQTLSLNEGVHPKDGPMEQYAKDQSLMLARFSLDGEERFRKPIIAHAVDRAKDNFPDHCLLWLGNRLLVSTGAHRKLKIREVDLSAAILATHTFDTSPTAIPGEIGNSLLYDGQRLLIFSSGNPYDRASLTATQLTAEFDIAATKGFYEISRRQTFPTGNLLYANFIFIGYISQERSESADFECNPYSPYLKVLDRELNVIADMKIGENGFAHVHPTLARFGNRLFVAWSKRITGGKMPYPQVFVEEFELQ
jgi:hypothetical protein